MKRTFLLIACASTLFLAACGGDSKLPNPTGKGAVRAINAIPGSPAYVFKIEERTIADMLYKESTIPVPYDDFDYVFNFDVRFPGDAEVTRVASKALKVEADRDHTFLLTGDLYAPTITVWTGDTREWEGTETVFEARFSHASESLGDIDIYFDLAGTVPGTNPPVATLSFGEVSDAFDYSEDAYVMTVTPANDLVSPPYFTSRDTQFLPRFGHLVTVFDGDANDTAPVAVRSMTSVGNPLPLADIAFSPKIRFINSAYTLEMEPVDIYDDELLTSLVASNLQFKEATVDFDTTVETKTYYFTPANSTATILFDQEITAPAPGTFTHVYTIGGTDSWVGARFVPDRAVSSTSAKLRIFHGALNFDLFDVYLKPRDEVLDEDDRPLIIAATFGLLAPGVQLIAGSYDIYLTEQANKTEIAGPYPIDVAAGDIVDLIAVDTADPVIVELVDVPVP